MNQMKKLFYIFAALLLVLTMSACSTEEVSAETYYVSIDINPSIEFVVDPEDNVISYEALNEDAETVINDTDFTGMNIEDAVELFMELATEAGYISITSDDNAVLVSVIGNDGMKDRLRIRIQKHLLHQYIKGIVITDEFTTDDLIAQADELGVTPAKLAVSLLLLDTDTEVEYTLEQLLDMAVTDLEDLLREYHEDSFKTFVEENIQEFKERREERYELYEERFNEWVDNHPDLTDEEIDALWDIYEARIQRRTRERIQDRVERWWNNRQNDTESTEELDQDAA
jgi:hypothetical protein